MDNPQSHQDDQLDEALEETFPASDPPANTVETGIVTHELPSPLPGTVNDNPALARFELSVEGGTAFVAYRRGPGTLTLVHTEVPESERGHGVGTALVEGAVENGRREGLRILAECAFAKAVLRKRAATRSETE
jgi:predicted GNAT family acetyltransferase